MKKTYKPIPIDREIKLSNKKIIVSKTDKSGRILYANDYFCQVSGYQLDELLGVSHNILRHPDMPKAIFYLMWQSIKQGNNITAMVKNLAKSGEYYWVTTDFEHHRNSEGEIDSYLAFRRPASRKAIEAIEELYSSLLAIEKSHGLEASLIYLQGYSIERHTNYNKLMSEIISPKSLMEKLFNMMKKTFIHNDNNVNYSDNYKQAV
ncbi:MAG TPA: PAS domain S-box protein [Campylobacterales bacterium]|nr:PAS domain S-box protein [Campylobacterales bacterium]